MMIYIQIIMTQ